MSKRKRKDALKIPATPKSVEADLREMMLRGASVLENFKWLYSIGHVGGSGESDGGRSKDPSYPTENAVLDERRARAREELRIAAEVVFKANEMLSGVQNDLMLATGGRKAGQMVNKRYARSIEEEELEGYREAKERRQSRGEGHGDG